jgi:hypothetical protein
MVVMTNVALKENIFLNLQHKSSYNVQQQLNVGQIYSLMALKGLITR